MTNTFRSGRWPDTAVPRRSEVAAIGIVAALRAEMRCHHGHSAGQDVAEDGVLAAISGIGSHNAEEAGKLLISRGATALVSWGCAAALNDDISAGDLFVPDVIVDSQGAAYSTDHDWSERIRKALSPIKIDSGNLTETDRILATPRQKRELAERTDARAADMESAALARLAQERDIPFVAIRAIVDTATMSIPSAMLAAMRTGSSTPNLLRAALMHPGDWLELLKLGVSFRKALNSLRRVARATGRRLAYEMIMTS